MAAVKEAPAAEKVKKERKKPAPRKQFLVYKIVDGKLDQDSIVLTRNPMELVTAIQRGDGSQFIEVQFKK